MEDDEEEPCYYCPDHAPDHAPGDGSYYICPKCGAEWYEVEEEE